jgi:hypothetical protein
VAIAATCWQASVVPDADLGPLLAVEWPSRNHWSARAFLQELGWAFCGLGDWAYAYRSPNGRLVARVSPFELGYQYFVDLCERCAGNRYVPRLDLVDELEGGGHLAVLEYLNIADTSTVEAFLRSWTNPEEADDDLRSLRSEVDRIDNWGQANLRWWVGIDIGQRHVLLSSDGHPKVIDLFGRSTLLFRDLISDPREFSRHIASRRRRYILDVPDLRPDDNSPDYLYRIRKSLKIADSEG